MGVAEYMRFPVEEYKRRCDKAWALMIKKDLRGLLITEGCELYLYNNIYM